MIQVYLKTFKGGCIKKINTLFPLVAMVLEEEYRRVPCGHVHQDNPLAGEFDFHFDLHIVLQLGALTKTKKHQHLDGGFIGFFLVAHR